MALFDFTGQGPGFPQQQQPPQAVPPVPANTAAPMQPAPAAPTDNSGFDINKAVKAFNNARAAGDDAAAGRIAKAIKTYQTQQSAPKDSGEPKAAPKEKSTASERQAGADVGTDMGLRTAGRYVIGAVKSATEMATKAAQQGAATTVGGLVAMDQVFGPHWSAGTIKPGEAAEKVGKLLAPMTYDATGPEAKRINEFLGKASEATIGKLHNAGADVIKSLPGDPRENMFAYDTTFNTIMGVLLPEVPKTVKLAGKSVDQIAQHVAIGLADLSPETRELARKAAEYKIPLRLDQLQNNGLMKMIGEFMDKIPLTGGNSAKQVEAFNKALAKTVTGKDIDKLTDHQFAQAMDEHGKTIENTVVRRGIADPTALGDLFTDINTMIGDNAAFHTPEVRGQVTKLLEDLQAHVKDGKINGTYTQHFIEEVSRLGKNTPNGELKHAMGEIEDHVRDAVGRGLTKEERQAYDDARKYYARGKTLTPEIAKAQAEGGIITPALVQGAVTRTLEGKNALAVGAAGEMGDLAKIGQKFLKEQKSSGTAERHWALKAVDKAIPGAAGGAGYAAAKGAAGAAVVKPVATGLLAARGLNKLNQGLGKLAQRKLVKDGKPPPGYVRPPRPSRPPSPPAPAPAAAPAPKAPTPTLPPSAVQINRVKTPTRNSPAKMAVAKHKAIMEEFARPDTIDIAQRSTITKDQVDEFRARVDHILGPHVKLEIPAVGDPKVNPRVNGEAETGPGLGGAFGDARESIMVNSIVNGKGHAAVLNHEIMHHVLNRIAAENPNIAEALMEHATSPYIQKQLKEIYREHPAAKYYERPNEAVVEMYAQWKAGRLKISDKPTLNALQKLSEWMKNILGKIPEKDYGELTRGVFDKVEAGGYRGGRPNFKLQSGIEKQREFNKKKGFD